MPSILVILVCGPQVVWMLHAKTGQGGKQQQVNNSPNLGPPFKRIPVERIGAKKSVRYLEKVDPRHVWASQSQVAGAERREREGVGEGASGRWKSFAFVRAATSRVGEERVATEAL